MANPKLTPDFVATAGRASTTMPPRGKGFDRRHIITIDGANYKPGPKETAIIVARMTAKQHAANWFWCCLELGTMALFFAGGAIWCILALVGG